MITASGVYKSYGAKLARREVLRGVSLSCPAALTTVIVGRSGGGKSTLLNILAGLEIPDLGTVDIGGFKMSGADQERAAAFRLSHLGLVFQFFNLLPTLSLRQNILLPAQLLGTSSKVKAHRLEALLDRVELHAVADALPHEVSGGEVQRAAIARALMNSPKAILADEPTGNLDEGSSRAVLDLLKDVAESSSAALLIVTHDPNVVAVADSVLSLRDGVLFGENTRTA